MTVRPTRVVRVDGEGGRRLDNFLLGRLKGVPRSRVYRMLRRGEVRVNGARRGPDYRLREGDDVRLPPHRAAPAAPTPGQPAGQLLAALRAAILYEDDHVLIVDKPCGLAVHGGSGLAFGVIEALRALLGPAAAHCQLAHRLDRDTSGCLAVAKSRGALLALHAQFRTGQVDKRYDAIVAGRWPTRVRRVDFPLARETTAAGERRVRVRADGEAARTDFAIERRLGDGANAATWLAAYPLTGRTHQIRVHAAASGHPIMGDRKYAPAEAAPALAAPRLMLHASELGLELPDGPRRFRAPPPPPFAELARRLAAAPDS